MDYRTLLLGYVALIAAYTLFACALAWQDNRIQGLVLVSWGFILRLVALILQSLPIEVPGTFTVMLANELYLASFVLQMLGVRWFVIRAPMRKRWPLMLLVPLVMLYTSLYLFQVANIASVMTMAEIVVCGSTVLMLLGVKRGRFQRVSRWTAAFLVIELLVLIYRATPSALSDSTPWRLGAAQYGPGWLYSAMIMMSLSACIAACNLCFFVTEIKNDLMEQASTDPLTGALNRRALNTVANIEIARSLRSGHAMCLLLLDVDRFKQINDRQRHHAGDAALQFVVLHIRRLLRSQDILARTGGDEFIVILPETGKETGVIVANRLCRSIHEAEWMYEGMKFHISLSIGVAHLDASHPEFEMLMRIADKSMYEAKRLGGNQVHVYEGNGSSNQPGVSTSADETPLTIQHGIVC